MWDMGDSEGIPYPNDLDGRVVDRFSVDVVVGKKHKKFSSLQALHFGQRLKQIGPLGALWCVPLLAWVRRTITPLPTSASSQVM
jgi:hypothetical protein